MKPVPSQKTIELQKRASDPAHSAFVAANAGSGKTFVLVDRVVRLLLDGVPPDRILCLTFTRAAAAQMQTKVAKLLGEWATMADEPLRAALAAVHGKAAPEPPGSLHDWHKLSDARRLFARALETPGGLKIQTIHAFCERLVHQFPFEANVAAGFEVMEERDTRALQEGIKASLYAEAGAKPDGQVGRALTSLVALGAEGKLSDVLDTAFAMRGDLLDLFRQQTGDQVEGAVRALAKTLEIDPRTTMKDVEADFLAESILGGDWRGVVVALRAGTKTDKENAETIHRVASAIDFSQVCDDYLSIFVTKEGAVTKRLGNAGVRRDAAMAAVLDAELDRVAAFVEKRRATVLLRRTAALWRLADRALQSYAQAKALRGVLDFDDLIAKTRTLLTRSAAASWVLYKLDGGIEHLLIDEAQDTSPEAWEIVKALAEEFTAGVGAKPGRRRTLFAVGDEKQSIYKFQGAEPEKFGEMRGRFEKAHDGSGIRFETVALHQSFRSAETVLKAVDHVFAPEDAHLGLESGPPRPTLHESARPGAPGLVELWPLEIAEPEPEKSGWEAPFSQTKPSSPVVKLADRIAKAAKEWIEAGVRPGEILILVRQRKAVFEALLRSLKVHGLPVAGADRLVVTDHIAVMDLLALGDALTSPDDDLSLAAALKSPLFGLDDGDLMQLAPKREGRLRNALLGDKASEPQRAAGRKLLRWETEARSLSPFEFYAGVLGRDGARRDFRTRLGGEADDALDAFLLAAEEFGDRHPPTLPGFLAFVRAGKTELKRDLDVEGGEIRVMTVHGAKGLEAELVVVAETGTQASLQLPSLQPVQQKDAIDGSADMPVWAGRQADDPDVVRDARVRWKEKEEHEHKRLLYVALTRAKDRLVVAGHKGPRKLPDGAWYDRVHDGLQPHAETIPGDEGAAPMLRLSSGAFAEGSKAEAEPDQNRPAWLDAAPPAERTAPSPLAPSGLVAHGEKPARRGTPAQRRLALARGSLLHRLLEHLPTVDPADRRDVAARLAGREPDLPAPLRDEILGSCLAILEDARFAPVFASSGGTEIALVGRLAGAARLSGRIDRLLVEPDRVTVIDYKSDAVPPPAGAPLPEPYVAQLAAYRLLLRKIYPGRTIRCALLWTAAPRLDEIGEAALDAAERGLSGAGLARAAE